MLCPSCKKFKEHYRQGYCVFCYEALYDNPTELKVIDSDFINELRVRGKQYEAHQLLKAFQKNIKNSKKVELKEIIQRDINIKKSTGYCSNPSCNNKTIGGFLTCERCRANKREYNQKKQRKNHNS